MNQFEWKMFHTSIARLYALRNVFVNIRKWISAYLSSMTFLVDSWSRSTQFINLYSKVNTWNNLGTPRKIGDPWLSTERISTCAFLSKSTAPNPEYYADSKQELYAPFLSWFTELCVQLRDDIFTKTRETYRNILRHFYHWIRVLFCMHHAATFLITNKIIKRRLHSKSITKQSQPNRCGKRASISIRGRLWQHRITL